MNCMDISSEKEEKSHTRKREYGLERESLKEKLNLLIAAENNSIRANYLEAKIHKMQQNSRCRLCGDKDETIDHISECCKLARKGSKTRHDLLGKVIH